MTPRLPHSREWTNLPKEFREKAAQVFERNFVTEASKGRFVVDGKVYPEEIMVRAGYIENGRLRQTNFEVSMDHSQKQNAMEKLYLGLDVLGSVFETHFEHLADDEEDDVDYPIHWEEFEFDDTTVFLRFSTVNTALEEVADRLLGIENPALFKDMSFEHSAEDALHHAEINPALARTRADEVRRALRADSAEVSEGPAGPDDRKSGLSKPDDGDATLH